MAQTSTPRPGLLDSCMADLGRQRQDELPLGGRERNGPSFTPGRHNGTSHYSKELKKSLKTGWNVAFHDIESEQMKGLYIEGPRPWAKKAHPPNQAGYQTSPDQNYSSLVEKPFGKLPEKVPTRRPNSMVPEKPHQRLPPTPPPTPPSKSESVLREGGCFIVTKSGVEISDAHYVMMVNLLTDRAYLVFKSPGKNSKILEVSDLGAPFLENQSCIVSRCHGMSNERYSVRLENFPATSRFKFELETLRRAALPPSLAATAAQPSLTTSRRQSSDSNTNRILDLDDKGSSVAENTPASSKHSRQLPFVGHTNKILDIVQQPLSQAIQDLVDLETIVIDRKEICENLSDFCRRVTLELTGSHMDASEDVSRDIQAVATKTWLKRGFIDDESDSLKTDLLGLVQLLDRIERRARMKSISTPASNSTDVMSCGISCLPRMKYSLDEIKNLRPDDKKPYRPFFSDHGGMTSSEAIVEALEIDIPLIGEWSCRGPSGEPEIGFGQLNGFSRPSPESSFDASKLEELSTAQPPSKLEDPSPAQPPSKLEDPSTAQPPSKLGDPSTAQLPSKLGDTSTAQPPSKLEDPSTAQSSSEDPSTAQPPSEPKASSPTWEPLQRGGLKTSLWCN